MIELSPGAVIGQFKLVKNLRAPLQSHSWLASAADGRLVVIKLFDRSKGRTGLPAGEAIARLQRLNHPALETSWILFEDSNWLGCARPWYEDLTHPGDIQFELDRLLALGMRLAEALQVSHDSGLAHNRLQQSNLFTGENNQLIVTDPATASGNAPGAGLGKAGLETDLKACGVILESWTGRLDDDHPRSSDENHSPLLPPRLVWLINALKSGDESFVKEGFARVRDELDDIRLQWQRALREGIPANWSEGRADYRPDSRILEGQPVRAARETAWKPLAAITMLLLLLIIAIWVLPAYFGVQEADQSAQVPAVEQETPEEATEEPKPPTEEELAALLAKREKAQTVLDEVINLKLQLESQLVNRWAEKAFTEAIALRDAGDEPYRNQDFDAAHEIYAQSRDELEKLVEYSRQVIEENIDLGHQAMGRGDSASAEAAFGLVLGIDPDNAGATRGLARAQSLDAVLALLEEASSLEETGALEEAREKLRQVRQLDPETDSVDSQISRLDAAIKQRNFRLAMSDALAALNAGDLEQARSAFKRAQNIQPAASGPREGLQEVSRQERDLAVLHQREQALAQEQSENWQVALNLYQSLLQQDPNLKFAQDSLVRARDRVNLDSELTRYLADPSAWWSQNGRKQAESLLVEARSVSNPGLRLQDQMSQLQSEIQRAGRQVNVELRSDQLCNVIVYKVGRFGQLESTTLELYPGYYTVVGTRDGFRDARQDFLVEPDQDQAVNITCDEPI